jgi:flagellar hook-associated protein 3 FlgL
MRTNPNIYPDILAGINQSEQTVQQALLQLSSGKRVNLPADDPGASAALVQSLTQSATVDSYQANASSTLAQAQSADAVLSSVVTLLNQAVTLGTEAGNGTESASNRQQLAAQVQSILASVVSEANTTYQGAALFAGTANPAQAFVADPGSPTGYTYNGNSGTNYVAAGDSLKVQSNVPGDQLFTNSSASVLGALSQLVSAIDGGSSATIGSAAGAVSAALNYVSQQHVIYGNTINQLTAQESFLSQETITLTSQQTALVGIDPAVAATNLSEAETHNSSVLAAAAKVLPVSLLDYLH